jgi:hypothetical protein
MICKVVYDFDGRSYGVVNFGNHHVFVVELLQELLRIKAMSGLATTAYWGNLVKRWYCYEPDTKEKLSNMQRLINLGGFVNAAMTDFLCLLDYPESKLKCCENPEIVCIDGIVLSCENRRIVNQRLNSPWIDSEILKQRFNNQQDRSLIRFDADDIILLRRYKTGYVSLAEITKLNTKHKGHTITRYILP